VSIVFMQSPSDVKDEVGHRRKDSHDIALRHMHVCERIGV
jgi:hypothetical protein